MLSPIYILFNVSMRCGGYYNGFLPGTFLSHKTMVEMVCCRLVCGSRFVPGLGIFAAGFSVSTGNGRALLRLAWLLFLSVGVLFLADGIAFFIRRLFPQALSAERKKKMLVCSGAICTAVVIAICSFGFWHAQQLEVVHYRVQIEKTVPTGIPCGLLWFLICTLDIPSGWSRQDGWWIQSIRRIRISSVLRGCI